MCVFHGIYFTGGRCCRPSTIGGVRARHSNINSSHLVATIEQYSRWKYTPQITYLEVT